MLCLRRRLLLLQLRDKLPKLLATSFPLDYKAFNELHDTSLALSRSAFFVNQVTCLLGPCCINGIGRTRPAEVFSGV